MENNRLSVVDQGPSRSTTPTRQLRLHIPNSHARATSPRNSPNPGTEEEREGDRHTSNDLHSQSHETDPVAASSSVRPWWWYFHSEKTSGESSRDFLARERTYFSWLRLSTFLAIASVALFLRLRLRVFPSSTPSNDDDNDDITAVIYTSVNEGTRRFANSLARKALRKRLAKTPDAFIERATLFPSQLVMAPQRSVYSSLRNGVVDTDPTYANVLGAMFFVLSVAALFIGHIDYMRCEQALEDADKLIAPQDSSEEGGQRNRMRWHNASSAKKAHSGRMVRIVEILVALAIFATALIILVTGSQGKISPLPS